MIEKAKNTVPWTHVISDLNGEKIVDAFYKKELINILKQLLKLVKIQRGNQNDCLMRVLTSIDA